MAAFADDAGGPGALFVRGHISFDIDLLTGRLSNLAVRGTTRNLCDNLI